jgi:hypothetical protein
MPANLQDKAAARSNHTAPVEMRKKVDWAIGLIPHVAANIATVSESRRVGIDRGSNWRQRRS